MKKVYGFFVIVSMAILCLGVGVKAIGKCDSLVVTGSQVLTATAYNDTKCFSGSIRFSYTNSLENVEINLSDAYIEVNGKKKVKSPKNGYTIGKNNPLTYEGSFS